MTASTQRLVTILLVIALGFLILRIILKMAVMLVLSMAVALAALVALGMFGRRK
jgi:hypothetical protein